MKTVFMKELDHGGDSTDLQILRAPEGTVERFWEFRPWQRRGQILGCVEECGDKRTCRQVRGYHMESKE